MPNTTNDAVIEQGRRSYWEENKRLNNPYPVGSSEFNDFERGWVQECKRDNSHVGHGIEYSRLRDDQYPEEKKKSEAWAYAKATGRG